ncbi:MAG: ABC transporter substrate-binding protein, partial [Patescibacteria group bacterium]|nr:ABC transporter substrate-binding protein [Patescibacteria group bacterium]
MNRKIRFYYWYILSSIKRHPRLFISIIPLLIFIWVSFNYAYPVYVLPLSSQVEKNLSHQYYSEGIIGSPSVLNPLFSTADVEKDINRLVYRGLVKTSVTGEAVPDLAEKFEIQNDREYIFYLKKDVYWHDGQKFTADDVVYTIQLAQNPNLETLYKETFKDVEVSKIDDYTVKFKLKESFVPFPTIITIGIIPKHIPLNNFKPVGTGIFKVKETASDHVTLTKNGFDLTFKFYPSYDLAIQALKLGEIQGLGGVTAADKKVFERWPNFKAYSQPIYRRYVGIFLNTKSTTLSERGVRQALAYATPTDEIIKNIVNSSSQPLYSPISPASWAKADDLKKYTLNLDKAKDLLDKAGWKLEGDTRKKDGKELSISISTVGIYPYPEVTKVVLESWKKLGIKVETRIFNSSDLKEQVVSRRQFDALITSQEINPDPDQYVLWHSTQTENANITGLSVPKIDKALEDARKSTDSKVRRDKYNDFQKY